MPESKAGTSAVRGRFLHIAIDKKVRPRAFLNTTELAHGVYQKALSGRSITAEELASIDRTSAACFGSKRA